MVQAVVQHKTVEHAVEHAQATAKQEQEMHAKADQLAYYVTVHGHVQTALILMVHIVMVGPITLKDIVTVHQYVTGQEQMLVEQILIVVHVLAL